jgi:hypothetical protein
LMNELFLSPFEYYRRWVSVDVLLELQVTANTLHLC